MATSAAPPPARRAPQRFDPWSGNRYGGLRWFAFSTVAHVGLLFLLATITLTVIRKAQQIKVKVVPDVESDGAPSLRDLAGVFKMEHAAPRHAVPSGPVVRNVRAPEMPRIGNIGPKLGDNRALQSVSTQLAYGSGAIGGLGGSFGDYVGGLRKVGLDMVLVIDTTDSMQFVIDDVKARLSRLVGTIQRLVPTSRIGIVVYRDKGDDYVTKWTDLSFHTKKLQGFLANINAAGGGDWEEAVKEGLDTAVHDLKWRKHSKKIIILVGDAPPHPWDVQAVYRIARGFRAAGGYISAIDVTEREHAEFDRHLWASLHPDEPFKPSPMPSFYKAVSRSFGTIAKDGGGELIQLDEHKVLVREILELTFGSRWKIEMAQYLKELS